MINANAKGASDAQSLFALDYGRHLWKEKEVKTVTNVTRRDALEFLELAQHVNVRPVVSVYPLEMARDCPL